MRLKRDLVDTSLWSGAGGAGDAGAADGANAATCGPSTDTPPSNVAAPTGDASPFDGGFDAGFDDDNPFDGGAPAHGAGKAHAALDDTPPPEAANGDRAGYLRRSAQSIIDTYLAEGAEYQVTLSQHTFKKRFEQGNYELSDDMFDQVSATAYKQIQQETWMSAPSPLGTPDRCQRKLRPALRPRVWRRHAIAPRPSSPLPTPLPPHATPRRIPSRRPCPCAHAMRPVPASMCPMRPACPCPCAAAGFRLADCAEELAYDRPHLVVSDDDKDKLESSLGRPSTVHDVQSRLREILRELCVAIGCERVTVWLISGRDKRMWNVCSTELGNSLISIKMSHGLAGQAATSGEDVISCASAPPRCASAALCERRTRPARARV